MKKIIKFYKKLGFAQGVIFTICLTSAISIATVNFPGFFVFRAGAPISSSEINSNFEKIAGSIVLEATFSTGFSVNESSFIVPTDCPTCHVYRKKINFNSISVSDSSLVSANDLQIDDASNGSPFHYFEVPTTGWYELRLITSSTATISTASCDLTGCNHNININSSLVLVDSVSAATTTFTNVAWITSNGISRSASDSNSDGVFDQFSSWPGQPPEIKRVYLKAGQVVFVRSEASYNQTSVTASYSFGVSSINLTIIKL